jgi:hypothetical protein
MLLSLNEEIRLRCREAGIALPRGWDCARLAETAANEALGAGCLSNEKLLRDGYLRIEQRRRELAPAKG